MFCGQDIVGSYVQREDRPVFQAVTGILLSCAAGLCELIHSRHSPQASQDRNYRVLLLESSLQIRLVHVIPYLTLLPHIFLETNQVRKTPAAQALAHSCC